MRYAIVREGVGEEHPPATSRDVLARTDEVGVEGVVAGALRDAEAVAAVDGAGRRAGGEEGDAAAGEDYGGRGDGGWGDG